MSGYFSAITADCVFFSCIAAVCADSFAARNLYGIQRVFLKKQFARAILKQYRRAQNEIAGAPSSNDSDKTRKLVASSQVLNSDIYIDYNIFERNYRRDDNGSAESSPCANLSRSRSR